MGGSNKDAMVLNFGDEKPIKKPPPKLAQRNVKAKVFAEKEEDK